MDWKPLLILVLLSLSWVIFIYHIWEGIEGNKGPVWTLGMFMSLVGSTGFAAFGVFLPVEQSLRLWIDILFLLMMMAGGIVMWMGKSRFDTQSTSPR